MRRSEKIAQASDRIITDKLTVLLTLAYLLVSVQNRTFWGEGERKRWVSPDSEPVVSVEPGNGLARMRRLFQKKQPQQAIAYPQPQEFDKNFIFQR